MDRTDERRTDEGTGVIGWLLEHERSLWILALACYGVGDTITTGLGLASGGATEIGPVVGPLVDRFGSVGLVVAKSSTMAVFYGLWRVLTTPGRVAIPLALAVVGAAVTGWNVSVLLAG
ncbi:hypothetical protein [Halovivax cerinus]|uniref:DUF5658 domain-containing protein n=1 Tax=Halovivax cerinus TaxID=1487865 RepID=A0ABD5NJL9_9EURY|nr:hypothetical protein [Halovivax cerinus]